MIVKHIPIEVTSKQVGKPVVGDPADLTAYILELVEGITDKKRPAVLLCPGGGYRKLSGREDQPVAMKYLEPYCDSWMDLAVRWVREQL